jgi:hypothetical protein
LLILTRECIKHSLKNEEINYMATNGADGDDAIRTSIYTDYIYGEHDEDAR